MKEYRYIGRDAPRPDAGDKVSGRAHYIHDLERPGMLFGAIKFSAHAHARIQRIDTSRAERLPGVLGGQVVVELADATLGQHRAAEVGHVGDEVDKRAARHARAGGAVVGVEQRGVAVAADDGHAFTTMARPWPTPMQSAATP